MASRMLRAISSTVFPVVMQPGRIGDQGGHVVWPAFDNYSVPLHGLARSPA